MPKKINLKKKKGKPTPGNFQETILNLQKFWGNYGCIILQPYDMEVGAGTFHPATTLRSLGEKPWCSTPENVHTQSCFGISRWHSEYFRPSTPCASRVLSHYFSRCDCITSQLQLPLVLIIVQSRNRHHED